MVRSIATVKTDQIKQAICDRFGDECEAALQIVSKESGLNPYAQNKTSGALGLFQFYPGSKLRCELSDIGCQVDAGYYYIQNRYGGANNALFFWQENHWF